MTTLYLFNPAPPRAGVRNTARPVAVKSGEVTEMSTKKKARSAAQRANDKRLGQMARARAKAARGGSASKARAKPRKATAKRAGRSVTVVMAANPAKRPAHRAAKRPAHHVTKKRHYRRNPSARVGFARNAVGIVKDALVGAAGSVAVGALVNFAAPRVLGALKLRATPAVAAGMTAAGALLVSAVAGRFGGAKGRTFGRAMAVGALTVAADRLASIYIAQMRGAAVQAPPATQNGLELGYAGDMGAYSFVGENETVGEYTMSGDENVGAYSF